MGVFRLKFLSFLVVFASSPFGSINALPQSGVCKSVSNAVGESEVARPSFRSRFGPNTGHYLENIIERATRLKLEAETDPKKVYSNDDNRWTLDVANDVQKLKELLADCDWYKNEAVKDPQIKAEAESVLEDLEDEISSLAETIKSKLSARFLSNSNKIIVDISIQPGRVGNDSETLVQKTYEMYRSLLETHRSWKMEVLETESGAFGPKRIRISLSGKDVGRYFEGEIGTHKFQHRTFGVPTGSTVAKDKPFTNAIQVGVFGEVQEAQKDFPDSEFKIETMRSQGPGGQNVNKVETAVRVTHIPTGEVVVIQSRSQEQSKLSALRILRAKLTTQKEAEKKAKENGMRREQINILSASGKVRTYNLVEERIADDRIATTYRTRDIFEGDGLEKMMLEVADARLEEAIGRSFQPN